MRLVVALGGNALLRRGERPDALLQIGHVQAAAEALAPLAASHELVIVHGNGPQVGLLALESAADRSLTAPYPLDALVAQTQGMIGYWLMQSLVNAGVRKPVVGLVSQTVVDGADPAFAAPTKPVGAVYPRDVAERLAADQGWTVAADGDHWRRVVASPLPQDLIEQGTVAQLLDAGSVVVYGGGGGAPVVRGPGGRLRGVEAVVDKDLVSSLLAIGLHADRLLVLTDVPAVMRDFGMPGATALRAVDTAELAAMRFPPGSMGPKIAACTQFVLTTGGRAAIGALPDAVAVLAGTAGTTVVPVGHRPAGPG